VIINIAEGMDLKSFMTKNGRVKINPLAVAVKKELDSRATQRASGIRKIEKCLSKNYKK